MTFSLLLVEDDPNDVLLGQHALLKAGFPKAQIARDGEEAIAYLGGEGEFADRSLHPLPGLVLLDLRLPRLSGFEVLRWTRAREGIQRLPVIVLTSSNERRDIDRAYECGANAYVVKPMECKRFAQLFESLRTFWMTWNMNPEVALDPCCRMGRMRSDSTPPQCPSSSWARFS